MDHTDIIDAQSAVSAAYRYHIEQAAKYDAYGIDDDDTYAGNRHRRQAVRLLNAYTALTDATHADELVRAAWRAAGKAVDA